MDFGTFVLIVYACIADASGKPECGKQRYTATEYGSHEICVGAGNAALQELADAAGKKLLFLTGDCVKGGEA